MDRNSGQYVLAWTIFNCQFQYVALFNQRDCASLNVHVIMDYAGPVAGPARNHQSEIVLPYCHPLYT